MSAIGNLNDYVKYQMAQGMAQPGGGGGVAGSAAEIAMGFAMAQQMANQPGGILGGGQPGRRQAAPTPPIARRADAGRRRQALGVTEADVLATLEKGDLKGRKIGSAWRVTKAALDEFLKQLVRRPRFRRRFRGAATAARRAAARGLGARQAPLPGVRRRGALGRRQAGAGVPVLRHGVAGAAGQRRLDRQGARPGAGAARHSRQRRAAGTAIARRCSARAARRSRSSRRRAWRSAASSAARRRSCPTPTRATSSTPRACCPSPSARRRCASRCAAGTPAAGSRRTASRRPR